MKLPDTKLSLLSPDRPLTACLCRLRNQRENADLGFGQREAAHADHGRLDESDSNARPDAGALPH